MSELISSRKNEIIKHAARLSSSAQYRLEQGLFLAEGARLCCDAAQSGAVIPVLFYTARAQERYGAYLRVIAQTAGQVYEVEPHVAELLSETKNSQGVFCVCEMPRRAGGISRMRPDRHYLALETVQDPANLGAALRTAEALGIGGVVLAGGGCDVYSPKAVRSAMGATFRLPFFMAEDMVSAVKEMNALGFVTLAAVPDASAQKITELDFRRPSVAVVGNEGNGLAPETVAACTRAVTIPMAGRAESLNASASAAILMWEMMRLWPGGEHHGD